MPSHFVTGPALHAGETCDASRVVQFLRRLRVVSVGRERALQDTTAALFEANGVPFEREAALAPGCRIDFLVGGSIGVELKKGKPNAEAVRLQLARYARTGRLTDVILLVERSAWGIPATGSAGTVRTFYVGLSKQWGIAV
ncbi:MAG: hypothetical protein H3C62_00725 [Gemmatimonadaceae bacterium]|nr:hypothetical protein [Gemmatimonadaceae bacterium]